MTRTEPLRVGVLASGGGTNLQALIDAGESGRIDARVVAVISNNSKSGALERARKHGIAAYHISGRRYPERQDLDDAIVEAMKENGVELVALAGYMKKLGSGVLQAFPKRIINIHPALLPSFGGAGLYGQKVHTAVLDAGCRVSGVTVHLVDEQYDTGPIIDQRCVRVEEHDTPETLAARVLEQEHLIHPHVVQLFAEGRIRVEEGRVRIEPPTDSA